MKLITLTTALALAATTALATVPIQEHPPVDEPPIISEEPATEERRSSSGGANDAALGVLAVLLGIVVLNALRDDEPSNPPCVTDQDYDSEKLDPYIVQEC